MDRPPILNEPSRSWKSFDPSVFVADAAGDGFACIRKACATVPELKAIVLSSPDDGAQIEAAFAAGAHAYVLKTAHPDDVSVAIRQTFDHSVFLPGPGAAAAPANTPVAVGSDASDRWPHSRSESSRSCSWSPKGTRTASSRESSWVTEQTVKFHLSNIYRKLDVANRTEASRWAQVHGLLNLAPPAEVGSSVS